MMLRNIILKRKRKKNGKLAMAVNLLQHTVPQCNLMETGAENKPEQTLPTGYLCT